MRHTTTSAWGLVLLGAAATLATMGPGRAQQFAPSKDLYVGTSVLTEGIKLGGWGSGKAVEDRTQKASGDASIRVETNGYFAGGNCARILFTASRIRVSRSSGVASRSTAPRPVPRQRRFFDLGSIRSTTSVPSS